MATRKSDVQVRLDSTSIAVLKAILHQVEQVKAKRSERRLKDSTEEGKGQLPLIVDTDEKGEAD
jgi:hypothetical protein